MARIHSRFSSPDPLNDDSYLSPTKSQSQSRSRFKEIISSQKKNKKRKTFELDVGNDISPQKIRVTVEAGDDEFNDLINLQSRPISRQKKKIMVCKQPSNDASNQNPRNKLLATPKQTRERSMKPAGAASNKRSVTKGKKSPSKRIARENDELKSALNCREELNSDVAEAISKREGRSLSHSRKSKVTPQSKSPARSPKKKTSNKNIISASKNGNTQEKRRHISSIFDTPQHTELSHNVSAHDDSDPKVVGPKNLQSKPLNEASDTRRSENHLETNTKTRLLANNNINSQVAKNSNLYQGGNYGTKSKSDLMHYPSPDSPEKFLDRNNQEKSIGSSKFQSNHFSELQNLEDDQELIESTHFSEYQESDTILQSEEFSMISVDSVPSLKEHLRISSRNCASPRRNNKLETKNYYQTLSSATRKEKMADQQYYRPPNSSSKNMSDLYQNSTQKSTNRFNDEISLRRDSFSIDLNQNSHQRDDSDQHHQQKTLFAESLPNENYKKYLSETPKSDLISVISASISQQDSSKVFETTTKIDPLPKLGENVNLSTCRPLTPEITSPLANELAHGMESLASSRRIPTQKNSRSQLDSCLTHSQPCSSSLDLKNPHYNSTLHQRGSQCTHKNISNCKSPLSPSSYLPSHEIKRCESSHNGKLRDLKENDTTISLLSARENSSTPQSTRLNSTSLWSPFISPSTNEEPVLCRAVVKNPLPPKKDLESLSWNLYKGCKNSHSSELSESHEKSLSVDDNSRFTPEAHSGQKNSLEIRQEFVPKANERQNDQQISDVTSRKPNDLSFIPEPTKVSHLNNLTSCLDSDEEEDFDLLLETINSATPLASRQINQSREHYELPSTPKSRNLGWSHGKIKTSNDKFSGSRISDKKKWKQRTKFQQDNSTQEISSASKRSENNFLGRINITDHQIPQKSNFKPTVRKTRDSNNSSFLNVSAMKQLPTMASNSNKSLRPHNSKADSFDFQSSPNDHNISSASRQGSGSRSQSKVSSFSTENFQKLLSPRYRASSPIFSNITNESLDISSESNDYILSSQFLSVDPSSSNQVISSEKQNTTPLVQFSASKKNFNRYLNSTPQKQKSPTTPTTSPTKSCLRSPIKSHVERLAFSRSPSKEVKFVSSSPTASSPICNLSSVVTWTRNHWLILDKIVQRWKRENNRENSLNSETYSMQNHRLKPRRNSTRVISQLLGKYIHSAEGERMKLEQWHLEVVDEFRGFVPGWDEKDVAMRLFALLVGERVRAERKISQNF